MSVKTKILEDLIRDKLLPVYEASMRKQGLNKHSGLPTDLIKELTKVSQIAALFKPVEKSA